MPVISFERRDLCKLMGVELDTEELVQKIPQIGADIAKADGDEFEVEFFPNRPDMYSVEGVARSLRQFFEVVPGLKQYEVKGSDVVLHVDPSVEGIRPYVVCGMVKGVEMTDELVASLMELQEKLHLTLGRGRKKVAIGVHDMRALKPPFTYKAVEPKSVSFEPLGYSYEMTMEEILEDHEKGRAYAHIVEDKPLYPLFVDSEGQVLSFPPVINGTLTQLTPETKDILLDLTGTDLDTLKVAINIVATALAERGGEIHSVEVKYKDKTIVTPDLAPFQRELDVAYVNSTLGLSLSDDDVISCLLKMGHAAESASDGRLTVSTPAYRNDIIHQVDLVEDVAVAYGYMRFRPTQSRSMTPGRSRPEHVVIQRARLSLIGLGFTEVTTMTLSSEEKEFKGMGLEPAGQTVLRNPITKDHTCLRTGLVPSLLEILSANKHRDLPQRVFEVGQVVVGHANGTRVGGAVLSSKASFTEMKSIVESFLRSMGLAAEVEEMVNPSFIRGRAAALKVGGDQVGYFGEVHPRVITGFELTYPITVFEFDLERLVRD